MRTYRLKSTSRRTQAGLAALLLLALTGLVIHFQNRAVSGSTQLADTPLPGAPARPKVELPHIVDPDNPLPDLVAYKTALRQMLADNADGRTMDMSSEIMTGAFVSGHHHELALDELASLDRHGRFDAFRIAPVKSRDDMRTEIESRTAQSHGARYYYPVLYIKGAPHEPAMRRIVTGQILGTLRPGVDEIAIAREYGLRYLGVSSPESLLHHFSAASGIAALAAVDRMHGDGRIAAADHDLIKSVQLNTPIPQDPNFADQWHLMNLGLSNTVPTWDINLYDTPPFRTIFSRPVWGDFDPAAGNPGIRGRGVRVGIVDDGGDLDHEDLKSNLGNFFEQHAYDFDPPPEPTEFDPNPSPTVRYKSGIFANHTHFINVAHGTLMAGIIGAVGDNHIGCIGVAPECKMVFIRAVNRTEYGTAAAEAHWRPIIPPLAPSADLVFASAMMYLYLDDKGFCFPCFPNSQSIVFAGDPLETRLIAFGDGALGSMIHIKNCSFGAPDNGQYDGAGPETMNARQKAVKEGRFGLGTVFVASAGDGRATVLDNANYDSYANAREVICVAGEADILAQHFINPPGDHNSTLSNFGACVMISAPSGGSYFVQKTPARVLDTGTQRGVIADSPFNISTTDWSLNTPARDDLDPPEPALYGLNKGGGGDYTNDKYTKRANGTSCSAAMVSGVVALMLEANPRLSWIDVQNMLIRSARNHVDPRSYLLNPAQDPPVLNTINGIDVTDPQDVVPLDVDWKLNGANIWWNHKYGAGMVNSREAVDRAIDGVLMPPVAEHVTFTIDDLSQKVVPDVGAVGNAAGVEYQLAISNQHDYIVTHATVTFDKIATTYVGDLNVTLTSPQKGMVSTLAEAHINAAEDLTDWTFNTVRSWGEDPSGVWKIRIWDSVPLDTATINPPAPVGQLPYKVRLTIYAVKRPLIPVITNPTQIDAGTPPGPTITAVVGESFTYEMDANNNPTVWHVVSAATPPLFPALPPGIALEAIAPSPATTYLPSRRLIGIPTQVGEWPIKATALNIGGESVPVYFVIKVIEPTAPPDIYTQWIQYYYNLAPNKTDPAFVNGGSDPDHDGYTNVAEFALGMNPKVSDASKAFTVGKDAQGHLTYQYNRYIQRGNLAGTPNGGQGANVYEFQTSNDLKTWTAVARSEYTVNNGITKSLDPNYAVTEGPNSDPTGQDIWEIHRLVTITDSSPVPPRFFRLKITPYLDPLNPTP